MACLEGWEPEGNPVADKERRNMKLYVLEIPNCHSCPHSRYVHEDNMDCLCFSPALKEDSKPVKDGDTIPPWCPLPDKGVNK